MRTSSPFSPFILMYLTVLLQSGPWITGRTPEDPLVQDSLTGDDTEVLSRRADPNRGGAQDAVQEVPQGEAYTAGHMEETIPMETGEEGRIQLVHQPNTIPESHMAPESGGQPPLKEGVHHFRRWSLSIQGRRIT